MRTIYMIKDLSTKSGLSIHTIKYYLRLGLIKEVGRGPDTNFRYFDDSTVNQLERIREMRRANMHLAAIKERLG